MEAKAITKKLNLFDRRVLAILDNSLGVIHPDVAMILNNLGWIMIAEDNRSAAELLIRRALAICDKSLSANHPERFSTLKSFASLLETQGDNAAANLLNQQLAIFEPNEKN